MINKINKFFEFIELISNIYKSSSFKIEDIEQEKKVLQESLTLSFLLSIGTNPTALTNLAVTISKLVGAKMDVDKIKAKREKKIVRI